MRRFLLFLPLLILFAAPGVLCAAEFRSDVCRFTLPEGFEISNPDDDFLFVATDGRDSISFLYLRTEQKISKRKCLAVPDSRWLSSVASYQVVATGKPWFARYDKYTVYRKPNGSFVKIYRYVTTRGVGFLVVKNASDDWTVADETASSCRGFRSLWEQVQRAWYWFIGAIVVVGAGFYVRERFASRRFWRKVGLWTLAAGALYGAGVYFFPGYINYIYLAIGLGYGFILAADDEDSSGDDADDSSSGYDGTGQTFKVDI